MRCVLRLVRIVRLLVDCLMLALSCLLLVRGLSYCKAHVVDLAAAGFD